MGIQGLLPLLKSIHKPCNLKQFDGQTIGVDAYGWLHRGTVSCAIELAQGKPTRKFVDFAMNRVRMLIHFGVKPYLVFDGDYLPSKAGTERERAARREESKSLGLQLLSMGKTAQAHSELQKAVDVTPEMARQLIDELKRARVAYVVAPYEADPQLAYLERRGIIDGILSEDSDLLVFGARCLLTKLDQYGDCVMIRRDDFTACREVSLVGWSDTEFRRMAIMSGCDYLAGINKMGLKTAYRLLRKYKTVERAIRAAQFDGKVRVPAAYLESFEQAERTFLYQWVYCPLTEQLVNLTEPDSTVEIAGLTCIGDYIEPNVAVNVARGHLHPQTKQPIIVKSTIRAGPNTPVIASKGQKSLGGDADLKKTPSIKQYFKRTPLQELDPNSFAHSPSQQRVLQGNRGPWSAEAAPARPRVSHPAMSASSTAPQAARRTVSAPQISSSFIPHPAKRQRLCSDISTVGKICSSSEPVTSPFFMAKTTDPSPSVRRATGARHVKKAGFNLWSDDSVDEEAMASLADATLESAAFRKPKINVFADNVRSQERADTTYIAAGDAHVPTKSGMASATSQTGFSISKQATSVRTDTVVKQNATPFDAQLSSDIQALRQKYSYSGSGSSNLGEKTVQDTRVARVTSSSATSTISSLTQTTSCSSQGEPYKANSSATVVLPTTEPLVPRSPPYECSIPPEEPHTEPTKRQAVEPSPHDITNHHPIPQSPPWNLTTYPDEPEIDIQTSEWLAMESSTYHPDITKLPLLPDLAVDEHELRIPSSLEAVKGSEDLLIPDSEAEEVEIEGREFGEDSECKGARTVELDLSRFAFAGG